MRVTSLLLLLGYICFYARYTYWAGDFAWGDRYVSTAVEMAALLAVPLLLRYRGELSRWIWRGGHRADWHQLGDSDWLRWRSGCRWRFIRWRRSAIRRL